HIRINTKEGIDTGSHNIVTDGYCLLRHPLRSASHYRKLIDLQTCVFGKFSRKNHHTGNIHAGSHMKNRRDISQFTDSLQTVSAEFLRGFVHKACLGGSLCGTSGCDDDDIVGNTFLHKLNVSVVRTDLRVVASYHGNSAADNAGSDALKKRLGGAKFVYLR